MLRVFVDDACVAVLKDKNVSTILVLAGRHRVQVRRDFIRSRPLEIDFLAGQLVHLGYGYDYSAQNVRVRRLRNFVLLGTIPIAMLFRAIGVPAEWGLWILMGVFSILVVYVFW